ncbi:MAG: T9SS type A sorting domain-containing protein [Bacteroidota bacterium]
MDIPIFDSNPNDEGIIIYPNPVSDTFKISKDIASASILNILGQRIKSFSKNQNEYSISNLTNGVYFIEVVLNTNEKYIIRFIKK